MKDNLFIIILIVVFVVPVLIVIDFLKYVLKYRHPFQ